MLEGIPGVTYKMFCSWPGEVAGNCTNEAVGEMAIHVDNNPLPGKEVMYLPICQFHLDKANGK